MFGQFSRHLLILVLVARLAQLPTPWLHCHQEIDTDDVATHQTDWHPSVALCELPRGWHLHFISVNFRGACDQRGNPFDRSSDSNKGPSDLPLCLAETDCRTSLEVSVIEGWGPLVGESHLFFGNTLQASPLAIGRDASLTLTAYDQWRYARSILLI